MFEGAAIPKGVQMVIGQLIKQAAPQLGEQVDQIGVVVRQFKEQLDRIEARQARIETLLMEVCRGNENGRTIADGRNATETGNTAGQ